MKYNPTLLPEIDAVITKDLRSLEPDDFYPGPDAGRSMPEVRVVGEIAQRIASLWRQLPPGQQMRCHTPPFALRFYAGSRLLVEGSICWECNNIQGDANGQSFTYGFNARHPRSQELFELLEQMLS